jgi:hypothetical protein
LLRNEVLQGSAMPSSPVVRLRDLRLLRTGKLRLWRWPDRCSAVGSDRPGYSAGPAGPEEGLSVPDLTEAPDWVLSGN